MAKKLDGKIRVVCLSMYLLAIGFNLVRSICKILMSIYQILLNECHGGPQVVEIFESYVFKYSMQIDRKSALLIFDISVTIMSILNNIAHCSQN